MGVVSCPILSFGHVVFSRTMARYESTCRGVDVKPYIKSGIVSPGLVGCGLVSLVAVEKSCPALTSPAWPDIVFVQVVPGSLRTAWHVN